MRSSGETGEVGTGFAESRLTGRNVGLSSQPVVATVRLAFWIGRAPTGSAGWKDTVRGVPVGRSVFGYAGGRTDRHNVGVTVDLERAVWVRINEARWMRINWGAEWGGITKVSCVSMGMGSRAGGGRY